MVAEVSPGSPVLTGVLALGLGAIHVVAGKLRFLDVIPRSRYLSVASGISVAYVFVHILPDLAVAEEHVRRALGETLGFLTHHVYLLSLLGLAVFYGLERMAKVSRQVSTRLGAGDITSPGVFWIHITSFAVYCGLVGYLLVHREVPGRLSLAFFFVAMATHFLVNDYGLRQAHKDRYRQFGRWLLFVAAVAGWAVGVSTEVPKSATASLFAFLAGGVILNVLKEELPEERQSSFGAFAAGAAAYAAVLLFI